MYDKTNTTVAPIATPWRVVLPGGSGHLGKILARYFHAHGHRVTVLTRTPLAAPWRVLAWDGANLGRWVQELEGADIVINLTGRSVNCRYSAANRREILDSRVGPTHLLGEAIGKLAHPPRLWMNASTATIYRHALDRTMDEATGDLGGDEPNAPPSWRFSIDVATRWEERFFGAKTPGTRKIALRSAAVMSVEQGGAFDMLSRLVRFGLGGRAGSGEQFISWVHEADFVRVVAYLMASEDIEGVVNVAAPCPLSNKNFMDTLRRAWGRRFGLHAARWMLEFGAVFLRTETELIPKSRRVVPGRLLDHGFRFQFSEWSAAAPELVRRWRNATALELPEEIGTFGRRPVSPGLPGGPAIT
jgi:uncharacterized protein (TIGR01777 family)